MGLGFRSHRQIRSAAMVTTPRVRPRTPMASLVDAERHPPRRMIPTQGEGDEASYHWTSKTALVCLAVFWAALPMAGLCALIAGPWAGAPMLGLAVSSIVAAYMLGSD